MQKYIFSLPAMQRNHPFKIKQVIDNTNTNSNNSKFVSLAIVLRSAFHDVFILKMAENFFEITIN